VVEASVEGSPEASSLDSESQQATRMETTHHPSGFAGALRGMGSCAVMRRQWYLQIAGWCTVACHFLETYDNAG
jgi:hypothetical protein